jgi:hypothetical protein
MPTKVLALKSTTGEGTNEMQRVILLMLIVSQSPA